MKSGHSPISLLGGFLFFGEASYCCLSVCQSVSLLSVSLVGG